MVAMAGFAAPIAFAAGAPAGTPIPNAATLTYSIAGRPATPVTAVAPVVVVAEVINVVLTWQDGTPVAVNSPDAGKALTFVLTNTGNGAETFGLARNNAVAGDQFDPTNAAAGAIYLESGVQAGFQSSGPNADILYLPGINDPVLAADASRAVYVFSSIPAALATGATGNVSLSASSTTPGAAGARPGTTLAGLGQGGVDAVVGGSRGQSTVTGGYIVSGISLTVAKTVVAVRDPQGGSLVMPGSVLTYRVVLTLTGAGIAENFSFADPLPASTTYVPASITVDGAARSDGADSDNASFAGGAVGVLFGNTPVPAARVIEFKVTVN
jgi:uncharacterized repeat protein (TIGR01451 family)